MHLFADDAADVVLAQDGGVELVRRLAHSKRLRLLGRQLRGWGRPTPS
jgi:hypothetical protein